MFVALLQLYWLSFGLMGFSALLALWRAPKLRRSGFVQYLQTTHLAVRAVVVWALGLMLFLPVVVPAYIFEWPLWVLKVEYLLLLAVAVGVVIVNQKQLVRRLRRPAYTRTIFVLGLVFAAVLLYDYVFSLRIGAPLYGDAPVQLAKITFFQHVHLALADPYYSSNGVVDPRYSTNLLDALMAVAASLLHTTAAEVWKYSFGVFRLAIWLSIFGLLWTYLGKKYRHLAYSTASLLVIVWSGYFLFAVLPDRIVLAWAALLLLGVKLWLETDSWPLLAMATVLIASTHALFSLIALGYLGLTVGVVWLGRLVRAKQLLAPALCIALLALPIGLNLYYPNHTNAAKEAYTSGALGVTLANPQHYGPFVMSKLPPIPLLSTLLCGLLAVYVWFANRQQNNSLRLLAYFAAFFGITLLFRTNALALVGYGLLIWQAKSRSLKIALALLFCYAAFVMYDPFFWRLAGTSIPPWFVARFQELNIFSMPAAMLGLLFLVEWPLQRWGYTRLRYVMLAVTAGLFVWYFTWPRTNDYNIATLQAKKNIQFVVNRQESLRALTKLAPQLQNQVVYSNDPNVNIRIPGVVPANVYSFNPENESPMTNIQLRGQCTLKLAKSLRLSDLQAAGITRIITDPPYALPVMRLAKTRPYLKLVTQAGVYRLYAVPPVPAAMRTANQCAIPFGE